MTIHSEYERLSMEANKKPKEENLGEAILQVLGAIGVLILAWGFVWGLHVIFN